MKLIHADATAQGLRTLWCYVYGLWFLIVLADPLAVLSDLPMSTFKPAGLLLRALPDSLEPWLLTGAFLYCLKFATALLLLLAVLNVWMKTTSVLSCFLLTVYQGIVRGFGYVDHAELALLFAAYFLSLFAVADALVQANSGEATNSRVDPDSKVNPNSIPFVAILAFLLFSYVFTGVHRLAHGGLEVFGSDTLKAWIVMDQHMLHQLFFSWNLAEWVLEHPRIMWILEIAFPFQLLVEILAPLCLVSRRFRYLFLLVMVPFHLLSWLFLKILFWENLLLYSLLSEGGLWKARQ